MKKAKMHKKKIGYRFFCAIIGLYKSAVESQSGCCKILQSQYCDEMKNPYDDALEPIRPEQIGDIPAFKNG